MITTTNTRPRVGNMLDLRENKRLRLEEDVGTISLLTPIEEKPDAIAVELVENCKSTLPTPEPEVELHEEHLPEGIRETEEELREHWFVGSIDQGTTSSRFLIFNGEGDPVANHQIEFDNHYPESG